MNRNYFWGLLAAVLLTACEKGLDELGEGMSPSPTGQVTNSVLQVRTRGTSPSEEATVAYPVQVYVFQGDKCKAAQTIGDEGQTLNIPLVEGTYSVYAIAGASATDYTLPTKDNATTTTALTLKEGRALTDLMAAQATATLVDGGTNTVTLGLQRKTMFIEDVTIKKIPTAATAVSVTIAPLWQSLNVNGTYSIAGQSTTIALTKQSDNRTWTNDAAAFVMPPSSQPASVSVNITIGGTTKTYTYSTSDQLEAAYKINIDGTYAEAVGVNLTGTITGATWLGERTISFEFDENGSNVSGNNDNSELDFYDANATTMQANIDAALATVTTGDISGWEVPTTAEATLMYDAREAIGNLSAGSYLCLGGTGYRAFKPTDAAFSTSSSSIKASTVQDYEEITVLCPRPAIGSVREACFQ